MEIEMKYAVPTKECADEIWSDEEIVALADPSSMENLVMKAIYYDTEDGDLRKNKFAVRVRAEGENVFATLKCKGSSRGGLFERNEINIPVDASTGLMTLDPQIFAVSDEGSELLGIIGDKPLLNILEMRFLRRKLKLRYGSSIMELALDLGKIISDKGEIPISEMEVELYGGKTEDIQAFGDKIAKKYNLSPKLTSKLKDGLSM